MSSAFQLSLRKSPQNPHFQTPQFRQTAQPSNSGVAGITTCFTEIIEHSVTVIGTHRNGRVAALLFGDNFPHNGVHIVATFQVIGFVKRAVGFELDLPQMQKIRAMP